MKYWLSRVYSRRENPKGQTDEAVTLETFHIALSNHD